MCIQGGCFSFCFSDNKYFICIGKLWASGSFRFRSYFLQGIMFFWLLVQVHYFAIDSEKYFCVLFLLLFLVLEVHCLGRLFWLESMYLLRVLSHTKIVVLLTIFLYDFPFLLKRFASLPKLFLF